MTTMKATQMRHIDRGESIRTRCGSSGSAVRRGLETSALLAVAVLLVLGITSAGTGPTDRVDVTRIHAESGDTLWSIAQSHPVEGLTTAETVELIVRLNSLESPTVATGGALDVPQAAIDVAVASK